MAQWNSLDDPTKLNVGQVLRVKPPAQPAVVVGAGRPGSRIESRPLEGQKPLRDRSLSLPWHLPCRRKNPSSTCIR